MSEALIPRPQVQPLKSGKIMPWHLERLAVVYVRQSTMQQVERHQESTRIQYGLVDLAQQMGWPRERVLVIDDDLGLSGSSAEGRLGFQRLLSELALDHVGLVLGAEMSRLARSCADWHQLLELCGVFRTLIGDLDGLYDPTQHNDRLLLGLKGTMSEAELHVLKQRLLQGRLQKARRGELVKGVPMGYVVHPSGEVALDPDEEARAVVQLVFDQFDRLGSAQAVMRHMVEHGIKFGVRVRRGQHKGDLEWRRPSRSTVLQVLKNPMYAGAYVFGRFQADPRRQKPGKRGSGRRAVPADQWHVCLHDRHPAYITWEHHQANLRQLADNRSVWRSRGSTRRGSALLSGVVFCGRCGARMTTTYANASTPIYVCDLDRRAFGGQENCQSLSAAPLDRAVSRLVLEALRPSSLEVSLRVSEQVEHERGALEAHWQLRLERARHEAERAHRQYHAVEPENRLVARSLEQAWEEKLRDLKLLEEDHHRFEAEQPRRLTQEERAQVHSLSSNLPRVWDAPSTSCEDRKAIIRLVVDKVAVAIEGRSEDVRATVDWVGGQQSSTSFRRRVGSTEQLSNYQELCARVVAFKKEGLTSRQIADRLNSEGLRPPQAERFTHRTVRNLLFRAGLTELQRTRDDAELGSDEWWLPELAKELGVRGTTVRYWVRRGEVAGRQLNGKQSPWIVKADNQAVERLRSRASK